MKRQRSEDRFRYVSLRVNEVDHLDDKYQRRRG